MIWNEALRIEHDGQRTILREGGLIVLLFRILGSGFFLAVGGIVVGVLIGNVLQGDLAPSEPKTWFKWLLFVLFVVLFVGTFGSLLLWMAARFALRDRFTIDAEKRLLTEWRGFHLIPIRRADHSLSLFREVAIRPQATRGRFGEHSRWVVSLEGDKLVKLVCAEGLEVAQTVAAKIGSAAALPVHRYPDNEGLPG
jgi:hypothetical protein